MNQRRNLIIGLLIVLSSCGPIKSNSLDAILTNSTLPTTTGSMPPDASAPLGASGKYLTTTGGYFSMAKVISTPLPPTNKIEGITSDGSNLYILLRDDQGSGIVRFKLLKTPINGGNWSQVCSFLDDRKVGGSLALTDTGFATLGGSCSGCADSMIRQFDLNCKEGAPISLLGKEAYVLTNGGYGNLRGYDLSFISTSVFGVNFHDGWATFNSHNLSFTTPQQRIRFAGQDYGFYDSATQFSSNGGWGLNDHLWKFNADGSPLGWAELPTTNYPYLSTQYTSFITAAGPDYAAILSVTDSAFVVFIIDVSQF